MKVKKLKLNQRKELEQIYSMLTSEDYESQQLGFGLLKSNYLKFCEPYIGVNLKEYIYENKFSSRITVKNIIYLILETDSYGLDI